MFRQFADGMWINRNNIVTVFSVNVGEAGEYHALTFNAGPEAYYNTAPGEILIADLLDWLNG